ncbi:MAG: aminoglycoside phosphotransferase family protein [Legionellaceae bacterium]|nr:aminoglycoside phosphotransferase family protein [Legionellaceae bacterium]
MLDFEENINNIYGELGCKWLANLPGIVKQLASKYSLTDLHPVDNMSFNYIAKGYQNSKPIILKLSLDNKGLSKEADCLKAFSNHGVVEIIAREDGCLIIEQAQPGTTLKEYFPSNDNDSLEIICKIIKKLHTSTILENNNFQYIEKLLKVLDNDLDIPKDVLLNARRIRDNLLSSTQNKVLLHGDLHHDNILKNGNRWLVIDPKGFIGDPVFDVCAFISNPIPELLEQDNPGEIINQRIGGLAKWLGYPEQRIRDWHYVKIVLCWAWCLEDNLDVEYWKHLIYLNSI